MSATNPHSIVGKIGGSSAIKGVSSVGTLDISELDAAVLVPASGSIAILTTGGATGKESVADAMTAIAGTSSASGLKATTGVLALDIADLTATTDPASTRQLPIDVAGVNKSVTVAELAKPIGAIIAATNATSALSEVDGAARVNIGQVTGKAAPVGADMLLIEDTVAPDANKNKMCTITQLAETMAGTVTDSGIENTAGVLAVVPASLTAATPVGGDSLLFADVNATPANAARKVTLTNLMEVVAGTVADTGIENTTGVLSVAPADNAITVGADSLMYVTAAGLPKKDLVSDVVTALAGTVGDSGLKAASGVLGLDISNLTAETINVAEDMIAFSDEGTAGDPVRKESVADLATAMAGTGLVAASGVLATKTPGQLAVGTILFGATGDCTSVTIGAVTYAYDATPVVADGEWAYGASAGESATNLAAAINGKTGSPYTATVNTDTVHVYSETVGTAGNVTITRNTGAQPATVENTVGGLAAATKQWCMRAHTVTANDVDTAVLVNIPMPFTPTMFTVQVRSSTGTVRDGLVTDLFTIAATPARIVATDAGAVHLVAGDIITITAHE